MNQEEVTNGTHQKWLDELTMELRLKDFSGAAIGDALASVEEFLADSGQSPAEAFGTPRDYAGELAGGAQQPGIKGLRGTIAFSATSLLAFLAFNAALTPSPNGGLMLISAWQLVSMLVLAALVISLPLYLAHLLRHTWALIAVPVVGVAAGILSASLTPKTAADAFLTLSPGPVLFVSAALMLALAVAGTIQLVRGTPDPIVSPLEPAPAMTVKARWFEILTQWLFPILAVFLVGFTSLLSAVA